MARWLSSAARHNKVQLPTLTCSTREAKRRHSDLTEAVAARTAAMEKAARLQRVKRGSCRLSIFWSCAMIAPVKREPISDASACIVHWGAYYYRGTAVS